jgi:hypothetical protein
MRASNDFCSSVGGRVVARSSQHGPAGDRRGILGAWGYDRWMAGLDRSVPDEVFCPLLGLAADRRSHFAYPHPVHRCFASGRPKTTDASRQTTYCLSPVYPACDRYKSQDVRQAAGVVEVQPDRTPVTSVEGLGTVIHVLRDGDTLARIAAVYGLTVEQIETANGLAAGDGLAPGSRLVIPLGPTSAGLPGPRPTSRRRGEGSS